MRPSGWTLRRRLMVVIISLLAAMSLVIGTVSVLALQAFLTERVDSQLAAAAQRTRAQVDKAGRADNATLPGPAFLLAPGQGTGTVAAVIRGGVVRRSAVLDSSGAPQALTSGQNAVLLAVPVGEEPQTVDLSGDLGEYRAVGFDGPGRTRLVIALPLRGVQAAVSRLILVIGVVAVMGLVTAAVAGALIVRSTLRPLQRVAGTATRVAQLPLHTGEVSLAERVPEEDTDPGTEVGQVGAALNRMLGHIEAALSRREDNERRTRQFIADASHELRTPLAAILGYAELTRRAPHSLPDDVVHAMARVESEANRMNVLVQDLLLLARLDTGPSPRQEMVDLRRLLTDAVGDAHASGPQHRWSLSLPDADVVVLGESDRLHQAVTNLLTNARVHTPPGTAVSVALTLASPVAADPSAAATSTQEAVVSVVDTGPGIPAELQPHVFERFARADTSRSRRAGSTGLGLSIVMAITHAHGGTVTLDSRPGHTAFTLRLPTAAPEEQREESTSVRT